MPIKVAELDGKRVKMVPEDESFEYAYYKYKFDASDILGLKVEASSMSFNFVKLSKSDSAGIVRNVESMGKNEKEEEMIQRSEKSERKGTKSHVWKIKAPSKMKHFLWQVISGCVATAERLTYRPMSTDMICPRCAGPVESINHLLFECPQALQVWALSDYMSLPGYFPSTSIYQNMNFLFWKRKEVAPLRPQFDTFPCWYIWKARNDKLFNEKDVSPIDTLQHASLEADCWRKANEKEEANEDHVDPLLQRLRQCPLGYPELPVKLMHHGSIMAASVA
uniref:Reverse transcriptase zinc-binding domain-containing protein n=1 Tax=Brassica oleracea TaxID=3712 RepID=A0A3P6FV02_BRAOL|nr:unnamed protein product [Brassica oleracea]